MKILKTEEFCHRISEIRYNKNCNHIDAILIYCEENEIEFPQVRRLITDDMRAKLEEEARAKNLLKKDTDGLQGSHPNCV